MAAPRVTHLRSVELDVFDIGKTAQFYRDVWGLEEVASSNGTTHLRGGGVEHHILTINERPRAALCAMHFAARDRIAVDALHAHAKAGGAKVLSNPAELSKMAGGGYGFQLASPDGHVVTISCDVARHEEAYNDRSKPEKLSHIVLNSANQQTEGAFFKDILGFRHSDATSHMDFIRCSADHHSIAIAKSQGACINHMAYELANFDGLMRGAGRVRKNGYELEWGVGRHGPGNNIFSYFVEPNGFVTEYTTEVERLDEATHIPGTPDYWAKVMNGSPDRWGMTTQSARLRDAMSGKILEQNNLRCDEIMAQRKA